MESLIPVAAHLAFWINAKVDGRLTDTDFANACESMLGFVLPLPSKRAQANATEIALDNHHILHVNAYGTWEIIQRENALMALDPTAAKQALLAELAQRVEIMNSLPTLGSRLDIDYSLAHHNFPHLPPLAGKHRESLDLALRIRLVCAQSRATVEVPSSASSAALTQMFLREIDSLAVSLICALASNA